MVMNHLKSVQEVILLLLCDMFSSEAYPVFFIGPEQHSFIISGQTPFQNQRQRAHYLGKGISVMASLRLKLCRL
jgi:hypothetical protein